MKTQPFFRKLVRDPFRDLFAVFFPDLCVGCHRHVCVHEKPICVYCRHDLPFAALTEKRGNALEKTFYGRCSIQAATALFAFQKKGIVQQLIHQLKYQNRQEIGSFAGKLLSREMVKSKRFEALDLIVPVPLHPKKQKKRGYNQLTSFGEELAKNMHKTYLETGLIRKVHSATQTQKIRNDRFDDLTSWFGVNRPSALEDKHVLLIDDVITTGATLEACCQTLSQIKNCRISIAVIACPTDKLF